MEWTDEPGACVREAVDSDPEFRAAHERTDPLAFAGEAVMHLAMCLIQAAVSVREFWRTRMSVPRRKMRP